MSDKVKAEIVNYFSQKFSELGERRFVVTEIREDRETGLLKLEARRNINTDIEMESDHSGVMNCALCGKEPLINKCEYTPEPKCQCCGVMCNEKEVWNRIQSALSAHKEVGRLRIEVKSQDKIISENNYKIMTLEKAVECRFIDFAHNVISCIRQGTKAEELLEVENALLREEVKHLKSRIPNE